VSSFRDLQSHSDEGRAFLLPLLASRITNTSLGHFVRYFVPLSEKLFELRSSAEEQTKGVEAKVWEACIEQVWACFKGFCEAPVDLSIVSYAHVFTYSSSPKARTDFKFDSGIYYSVRTIVNSPPLQYSFFATSYFARNPGYGSIHNVSCIIIYAIPGYASNLWHR